MAQIRTQTHTHTIHNPWQFAMEKDVKDHKVIWIDMQRKRISNPDLFQYHRIAYIFFWKYYFDFNTFTSTISDEGGKTAFWIIGFIWYYWIRDREVVDYVDVWRISFLYKHRTFNICSTVMWYHSNFHFAFVATVCVIMWMEWSDRKNK